jgi:hypothetical protein
MKRIFTVFFLLFFSVWAAGSEIPFEIVDVDGESHVGRIANINAETIQIDSGSGGLTFSPRRVEIVQNLMPNPFLQQKSNDNKSNSYLKRLQNQRQPYQRTVLMNGQLMGVNEFGVLVPITNPQSKADKLSSSLLQKLRSNKNENNNATKDNPKMPQFPKSVIVIDLIDGGRLVATSFIVKNQKAVCNLLDHNYIAPTEKDETKTNNTHDKIDDKNKNKNENKNENKISETINNKNSISEITIPLEQIYSVRFAVKSFAEIVEPSAEWNKYTKESGTSGDRLVISKNESFDIYSGIVSEVTSDSVIFTIDNEKLPIKRSRIFGMILHSPNRDEIKRKAVYNGQITLWTGTQLMLDSFALEKISVEIQGNNNIRNDNVDDKNDSESKNKNGIDETIENDAAPPEDKISWKALAGFSGETFLSEIDNIIFSRGNSLYLSELMPIIRERLLPFEWISSGVAKPDNLSPLAKLKLFQAGKFGVNKDDGGKIDPSLVPVIPSVSLNAKQVVNQPIPAIEGVILDGISYRRGLTLSPKTKLEYVLNDNEKIYSAIRGVVGIDDRLKPNGRAKLSIEVDGKLICEIEIRGTDMVKSLKHELPETHKKITITVDFIEKSAESVPISIGDLKLIK